LNKTLASNLQSLSIRHERRKINRLSTSYEVYFLHRTLWWSKRLYPRAPQVATQYNNLFGYGRPGASDTLVSEIEVIFRLADAVTVVVARRELLLKISRRIRSCLRIVVK
jgi:hypothetical protein